MASLSPTPWIDEEELKQLWWIGALIYVAGSILINFGSNLIRRDHSMEDTKTKKTPQYLRPLWILGKYYNCLIILFNSKTMEEQVLQFLE